MKNDWNLFIIAIRGENAKVYVNVEVKVKVKVKIKVKVFA
jgi:hypothetical protein